MVSVQEPTVASVSLTPPTLELDEIQAVILRPRPASESAVRRRVHGIETFNVLRGGEYYFLPMISALTWIANLSR